MDDRRALLSAIIASPDEDAPRLVFADWLQEHGDEHDHARAEFIRLQVEAARTPDGPGRAGFAERAVRLEQRHRAAWLAPLTAVDARLTAGDPHPRDFSRGLYRALLVDTSKFLQKACQTVLPDALAAVGVEALGFYSATKRFRDMAASPAIRWVARVQYPGADDAALDAFGASGHFAHLSGLEFDQVTATDAGLTAFAAHSARPG